MAVPHLRLLAAFGLSAACGVAGSGVWMLTHPRTPSTQVLENSQAAHSSDTESGEATSDSHAPPASSHEDAAATVPEESAVRAATVAPSPAEPSSQLADVVAGAIGSTPEQTAHEARRAQGDVIRADEYMRRGDLANAMKLYANAVQTSDPATDPVVFFRWALCSESLGLLDETAHRYQHLAKRSPSPAWRGFARWGLGRILQQQGRTDLAIRVGSEIWMTQDQSAALWRDDLTHWFGHVLYRRAIDGRSDDLLLDETLASCSLTVPMSRLLAICNRIHAAEIGAVIPDSVETDSEGDPQFTAIARNGDFHLDASQASVAETIDQAAKARQWTISWTPRSAELARSRTMVRHVTADAPTVFDAACEGTGLLWSVNDSVVSVQDLTEASKDDKARYSINVAARLLSYAIEVMPGHQWSPESRVGLAQLAALRGEFAVAQRTLEELVRARGPSPVSSEAWYDLGKLRTRDGRLTEAITAFERCSDHSTGTPLEPVSNLYLGRLLLEAGRTRESILALRRATVLAGPAIRPKAAVVLAAAYLVDERPQSANEVLRTYQSDLDVASSHDAAAFLSALSQVRGTSDPFRKKYDQKSLMAAVSHVGPDDFFSWQGAALIAAAYRELGLREEGVRIAAYAVERMQPCQLRSELSLILADDAIERRDAQQAISFLSEIAANTDGSLRSTANERLCTILLEESRGDEAKALASAWLDASESPEEQVVALRSLGRCLEREGDRLNAALCFAGSRPSITPKSQ